MKKLTILGLFLALGAISAFPWLLEPKIKSGAKIAVLDPQNDENKVLSTVQELASEGCCVADTLKEELAQEHDRLIKQIKITFPVTPEKWGHALSQFNAAKSQDKLVVKTKPTIKNKPNDLPLVKRTREILASYNIDPNAVTIKIKHDPKTKTNAASYQGYINNKVVHDLELNIPRISEHPQEVQEAIIRHEIMHLLNYDPLERAYIEVMLMENSIKSQKFMKEPAMQNLYKHQEFRADLLAACHSIDTAQAFQKDFEHYIETFPQDQIEATCTTHPSDLARHQAVTQLISYMQAESTIKIA